MKEPIYLDYMATTPVDPKVVEVMMRHLGPEGDFGNPASSTHVYGQRAAMAVEKARAQVANVIGAFPDEIVFTSGATEAINLAILGAAHFYQRKGRHLITMNTEHKAVLDSCAQLEREGFTVTYISPKVDGLLDLTALVDALREDTILVSIMHVNNEIGVVQDIAAIGEKLRNKGIIFHVDAAQSVGRLAINVQDLGVDLMSLSAHKNYGPKGVGALFIRQKPRIRIQAQSFGGGHQKGMRSGTIATHQVVGMGEAFELTEMIRAEEQARLLKFRQEIWKNINQIPGVALNGSWEQRIAGNLNFSVSGVDGARLIPTLCELAISSTSACVSASIHPSYVLKALGLSDELAFSSIRLSIGRFTTQEEIEKTIAVLCNELPKLQKSN